MLRRLRPPTRRALARAAAASLAFAAAGLAWLSVPAFGVPEYAQVRAAWRPSDAWLLDRNGALLDRERLDFGVRRLEWVQLVDVSPALVNAVIRGEDQRFREHAGVDWRAVVGAAADGLRRGRLRGASTITMQLASLIDARAARGGSDLGRKLAQLRVARAIESRWTKDQILEAYLNLLGFRGELQGVAAAAELLAGKSPSGLDEAESLVLAALLPAPGASRGQVVARACARAPADRCMAIGAAADVILSGKAAPRRVASLAPQLARQLLKRPGSRVVSTVDARLQSLAADALARQLSGLGDRNVRDGAVLVVENSTGAVLAYVGSAGPGSRAAAVDGVRARRQAGSTLKPFLYGLALERRYLTGASLLDDSPVNLDTASGVYLPQNYDGSYRGLVSARLALGSSLNVPAVRTLVLVGVEPFRERLWSLGYRGLTKDGEYYGYSLALGSAEVSLWEQAQAYRALARNGLFTPLTVTRGVGLGADARLMPADASFVVSDILADRLARAPTFGLANHLNTPFWSAVKTGTSKDMRDNWCVGFSPDYTVAVWVGNFEGDAMHDVSGVTGAAPVWQEIMLALHAGHPPASPAPPAGVVTRFTRFNPAVEAPRDEWFLAGTEVESVAGLPSGTGIARITSPANGMVIALDPDIPPAFQRVPLETSGTAPTMTLALDDRPFGGARDAQLWQPRAGVHTLAILDAEGRTLDRVLFTVR
jgi:penicillin-binding protein 1C